MSLGHTTGTGGRAFLYASAKKNNSELGMRTVQEPVFNKVEFKLRSDDYIKEWNHYDSNMNNTIVEQRKILKQKNYELDSRAWGLKDYGV